MQHFLISSAELHQSEIQISDRESLHQMKNVMRFRAGSELVLMNGKGGKAEGIIKELHKKGAVIELKHYESVEKSSRVLRLYCALSKKPATFELVVQKATEIGVTHVVPLVTARCQIDHVRKVERLEAIIKESCEQCERLWMPQLGDPIHLEQFLELPASGQVLAGDPWTYDARLSDMKLEEEINLIIGPEGGLTDEELSAIRAAGGQLFLLGKNILRMETAAIAALSLIQFGKI